MVLKKVRIWRFCTFNPFPKKAPVLCVCNTSLLKTLWEKKKLLVTSNFSISHSVFYVFGELYVIFVKLEIVVCKLFQFGSVLNISFGKELKKTFCCLPFCMKKKGVLNNCWCFIVNCCLSDCPVTTL